MFQEVQPYKDSITMKTTFLSEEAQVLITGLRGEDNDTITFKAAICDAMSIIMLMHQVHASEKEKKLLLDAIDTLVNYNELITALSKEK